LRAELHTQYPGKPAATRGEETHVRTWIVITAALLAACALAGPGESEELPELHILLTNDDGIDAVGLQTLKEALREAGHRVTVVAPASNQSGKSASLTFGALKLEKRGEDEYALDATPATCALFGMTALADADEPFGLLVSGTNHGANAGPAANVSGTVGATTIAALGMGGGLPAIAMSTDELIADETDDEFTEHFENAAAFAVRLIARLQQTGDTGPLIPPGVRLNVNYPARAPEEIKGVRVASQGGPFPFGVSFEEKAPGIWAPKMARGAANDPPPDADGTLYAEGWISIAPLDTDQTAAQAVIDAVRRRLADLPAFVEESF
jgi:5'/3'-nucleotidase SurE